MRRSVLFFFFGAMLAAGPVHAQRAQAGGSWTLSSFPSFDRTKSGVGGWLTVDSGRAGSTTIGLDVSVDVLPQNDSLIGRQTIVLGGLRAGVRTERYAAVARVRPGMARFSERVPAPGTICIAIFPPPESCLGERTNFATEFGGALELFPTPRSVVRFEAGDVLVRFGGSAQDSAWTHTLRIAAGAGVRF